MLELTSIRIFTNRYEMENHRISYDKRVAKEPMNHNQFCDVAAMVGDTQGSNRESNLSIMAHSEMKHRGMCDAIFSNGSFSIRWLSMMLKVVHG